MKNLIILSFLILVVASCGTTRTIHRTVERKPAIKPRKISHLDCVKELLQMDVESDRANKICISIFRKDYEEGEL